MTMIKLNEYQDRVHAWAESNFDLRAHSKEMLFHGDDQIDVAETADDQGFQTGARLTLDEHSKGQICRRFILPKKFMFDDDYFPPDLRKTNFDYKFRSESRENMLVRGRHTIDGDTCRGLLTKDYRPYDNVEFIDAIVEAVNVKGVDPRTVEVGSWHIGNDMHGIGILPNITFDQWGNGSPPTADGGGSGGLHPGFKWGNSEVGRRMTRMDGGGWRGHCDNGVIYGWKQNAGFKIVHRGQKVMALMVNEAIADALLMSEQGAQAYMEKMALKVERTDIDDIINGWAGKYGFTVDSKESWEQMVGTEAIIHSEISEFDVINALTYVARDTENADEQELLQRTAGDMIFAERLN